MQGLITDSIKKLRIGEGQEEKERRKEAFTRFLSMLPARRWGRKTSTIRFEHKMMNESSVINQHS